MGAYLNSAVENFARWADPEAAAKDDAARLKVLSEINVFQLQATAVLVFSVALVALGIPTGSATLLLTVPLLYISYNAYCVLRNSAYVINNISDFRGGFFSNKKKEFIAKIKEGLIFADVFVDSLFVLIEKAKLEQRRQQQNGAQRV